MLRLRREAALIESGNCVRCGRSEQEAPILQIHFKGKQAAICSSCLPILIHRPHELADKLEGAESIDPAEHNHH